MKVAYMVTFFVCSRPYPCQERKLLSSVASLLSHKELLTIQILYFIIADMRITFGNSLFMCEIIQ